MTLAALPLLAVALAEEPPAGAPPPFAIHVGEHPDAVVAALAGLASRDGSPLRLAWSEPEAHVLLATLSLPGATVSATPLVPPSAEGLQLATEAAGGGCVVWVRPGLRAWFLLPGAGGCLSTTAPAHTAVVTGLEDVVDPAVDSEPKLEVLAIVARARTPDGWSVVLPTGREVDTVALARHLGDEAVVASLGAARRASTTAAISLAVTGGILSISALGVAASLPDAEEVPEQPDPERFRDLGSYVRAQGRWQEAQADADARDEEVWAGVTLATGGALCFALVPLVVGESREQARHPSRVYERDELQRRLEARAAAVSLRVGPGWVGVVAELP